MAADLQALPEPRDVGHAVVRLGQEMKRRPVVPDVVRARRLPCGGVGHQPVRAAGAFAETGFRRLQCRRGQIEHGDVVKSAADQFIGQP